MRKRPPLCLISCRKWIPRSSGWTKETTESARPATTPSVEKDRLHCRSTGPDGFCLDHLTSEEQRALERRSWSLPPEQRGLRLDPLSTLAGQASCKDRQAISSGSRIPYASSSIRSRRGEDPGCIGQGLPPFVHREKIGYFADPLVKLCLDHLTERRAARARKADLGACRPGAARTAAANRTSDSRTGASITNTIRLAWLAAITADLIYCLQTTTASLCSYSATLPAKGVAPRPC